MTNREKYKFDDFTFTNYRKLIQLAKAQGFEFILHKDDFKAERKDIIWRHDVEFEPDLALKMAQIEHEEGVQATYCTNCSAPSTPHRVCPSCGFYNGKQVLNVEA